MWNGVCSRMPESAGHDCMDFRTQRISKHNGKTKFVNIPTQIICFNSQCNASCELSLKSFRNVHEAIRFESVTVKLEWSIRSETFFIYCLKIFTKTKRSVRSTPTLLLWWKLQSAKLHHQYRQPVRVHVQPIMASVQSDWLWIQFQKNNEG